MVKPTPEKQLESKLTALINSQEIVQQFMLQAISGLHKAIATKFGDKVIFYLAGNASLNLLKSKNQIDSPKSWSDWDTQLIINPALSITEWYQTHLDVNKLLIEQIEGIWNKKGELTSPGIQQKWLNYITQSNQDWTNLDEATLEELLQGKRSIINKTLSQLIPDRSIVFDKQYNKKQVLVSQSLHPGQRMESPMEIIMGVESEDQNMLNKKRGNLFKQLYEFTELPTDSTKDFGTTMMVDYTTPDFYLYRMVLCFHKTEESSTIFTKAPLLDISIPRRNYLQGHINWYRLKDKLTSFKKGELTIPIPDQEYHYNENLFMLFEAFDGKSHSSHKAATRLDRAKDSLQMVVDTTNESSMQPDLFPALSPILSKLQDSYSEVEYFAFTSFLKELHDDLNLAINDQLKSMASHVVETRLKKLFNDENDFVVKAIFEISQAIIQKRPQLPFDQAHKMAQKVNSILSQFAENILFTGDFALSMHLESDKRKFPIDGIESIMSIKDFSEEKILEISDQLIKELKPLECGLLQIDNVLWVYKNVKTETSVVRQLLAKIIVTQDKSEATNKLSIDSLGMLSASAVLADMQRKTSLLKNYHLIQDKTQKIRHFTNSLK